MKHVVLSPLLLAVFLLCILVRVCNHFLLSFYFFVMYTSNVECRIVFDSMPEICHHAHVCFPFVSLSRFMCNQLYTISIIMLNRKAGSLISPLNLLLLSVKNAGLHVYNMDILYTAKHAGPYQTPPLERLVLHLPSLMQPYSQDSVSFFLSHLFLFIIF